MRTKKNTIVLATGNKGKIAEFSKLLSGFKLEVIGLNAFPNFMEVEETGATFEENALLKARAACAHSGLVALADDSGLSVDVLDGAPGVRSARYYLDAGIPTLPKELVDSANITRLLKNMHNVPQDKRGAKFCSAIAAVAPDGSCITTRGEWAGQITEQPYGVNGFGYDPIFFDPELKVTAAQMSMEIKNSRSHRAKALLKLKELWPDFWSNLKRT